MHCCIYDMKGINVVLNFLALLARILWEIYYFITQMLLVNLQKIFPGGLGWSSRTIKDWSQKTMITSRQCILQWGNWYLKSSWAVFIVFVRSILHDRWWVRMIACFQWQTLVIHFRMFSLNHCKRSVKLDCFSESWETIQHMHAKLSVNWILKSELKFKGNLH